MNMLNFKRTTPKQEKVKTVNNVKYADVGKEKKMHYVYNETNVMHSLFSLLRIKGLYMFRALLAHPQEALHKRHLV
jgi:hypothetical protein